MISNTIAIILAILFVILDIKIFPQMFIMAFGNSKKFKDRARKAAMPDLISLIKGQLREDLESEFIIKFFIGILGVIVLVEGLIVVTFWRI